MASRTNPLIPAHRCAETPKKSKSLIATEIGNFEKPIDSRSRRAYNGACR